MLQLSQILANNYKGSGQVVAKLNRGKNTHNPLKLHYQCSPKLPIISMSSLKLQKNVNVPLMTKIPLIKLLIFFKKKSKKTMNIYI